MAAATDGSFSSGTEGHFYTRDGCGTGTSSVAPLRMVLTFILYSKDSLEQDRLYSPAGWLFFGDYLQMR